MQIPYQSLKNDTLKKVIESFVVREGTEYGDHDVSLANKVEKVMEQIKDEKIKILYSERDESINLVTNENLAKYMQQQQEPAN